MGVGAEGVGTTLVAGAAVDVTVGKAVLVTASRSVSAVSSHLVLRPDSLGLGRASLDLPGRAHLKAEPALSWHLTCC